MNKEDKIRKCAEQLSQISGQTVTQEQTKQVRDLFLDLYKDSPELRFTFDKVTHYDPNL
jgi:hypothetical protein